MNRRSLPRLGLLLLLVAGASFVLASCRSSDEAEGGTPQAAAVDLSGVEVEVHQAEG